MTTGLVLLAHGSRDPSWAAPIHAVAERIRMREPAIALEVAFLELASPSFAEAVDQLVANGAARIATAPVFLGQGAHVRRDVAALVETARHRWPAVAFSTGTPFGEDPSVLDAVAGWALRSCVRDIASGERTSPIGNS